VRFVWMDGGAAVTEWWIYIGTRVGANDLLDSGALGSELSMTVDGLPTDGVAIGVRLWYLLDGTWQFRDFHYAAASELW